MKIINYGATIAKIEVPDRDGCMGVVLLGHEEPANYIGGSFFLGATVGRYANRIDGAHFVLNGKEYKLTANKIGFMLHGVPRVSTRSSGKPGSLTTGTNLRLNCH